MNTFFIFFSCLQHGLEVSLLERIMMTGDVYQRQKDGIEEESISRENVCVDIGRYNNKYITKLVKNYRTHPDILRVSFSIFFQSITQIMIISEINESKHEEELLIVYVNSFICYQFSSLYALNVKFLSLHIIFPFLYPSSLLPFNFTYVHSSIKSFFLLSNQIDCSTPTNWSLQPMTSK